MSWPPNEVVFVGSLRVELFVLGDLFGETGSFQGKYRPFFWFFPRNSLPIEFRFGLVVVVTLWAREIPAHEVQVMDFSLFV